MNFQELRDRESVLVQNALKLKCPVCKADSGQPCKSITDASVSLMDKLGSWVHMIRADGQ